MVFVFQVSKTSIKLTPEEAKFFAEYNRLIENAYQLHLKVDHMIITIDGKPGKIGKAFFEKSNDKIQAQDDLFYVNRLWTHFSGASQAKFDDYVKTLDPKVITPARQEIIDAILKSTEYKDYIAAKKKREDWDAKRP